MIEIKVADLQATGQSRGVKKTVYTFVSPPKHAALAFTPAGMLEVRMAGNEAHPTVIDPGKALVTTDSA
jgi:hypothetical protein